MAIWDMDWLRPLCLVALGVAGAALVFALGAGPPPGWEDYEDDTEGA